MNLVYNLIIPQPNFQQISSLCSEDEESEEEISWNSSKIILNRKIKLEDLDEEVLKHISDYSTKLNNAEKNVIEKLNLFVNKVDDKIK